MVIEQRNRPDFLVRILLLVTFVYLLYSFFQSFFHVGRMIRYNLLTGLFLLGIYMLVTLGRHEKHSLSLTSILIVGLLVIWDSYVLTGVLWASDIRLALLNGFFNFGYLIFVLLMLFMIDRIERAWFLLYFFNFILLVFIAISCWEMITFNHFETSSVARLDTFPFVPNGPFYNVNDFASALLILSPFMFALVKALRNRWFNALAFVVTILIFITMLLEGSRLSLVAFIGEALVFYLLFVNWKAKIVIAALIWLLFAGFIRMYPAEYQIVSKFLDRELLSIQQESKSHKLESIETRVNLLKHALEITEESNYTGVGSGNFSRYMRTPRLKDTAQVTITHNFFMEKLATDGLPVFLFLVSLIGYLVIGNLYYAIKVKGKLRWLYAGFAAGSALFVVSASIPSSISSHIYFWVILGGAMALLNISYVWKPFAKESSPVESLME